VATPTQVRILLPPLTCSELSFSALVPISFGMEERKGTPIARWLESQMDPEQLARMRERQERLAWMRKWDAFVGWAWVGMLLVGGLVWLTLL
jgi:hypothetical protein